MKRTYERFVHFAFVGIIHVVNILFGLAIGGVMGHWFLALGDLHHRDIRRAPGPGQRFDVRRATSAFVHLLPDLRLHRAVVTADSHEHRRAWERRECALP